MCVRFRDIIKNYWFPFIAMLFFTEATAQDKGQVAYGVGDARSYNGIKVGGVYYNNTGKRFLEKNADFVVTTKQELVTAIKSAKNGDVIYLPSSTQLDMTGYSNLKLNDGIQLIGDKDINNGPLIYVKKGQTDPLFIISGSNVVISGIRFFGPDEFNKKGNAQFTKEKLAFYTSRSKKTGVPLETYRKMYAIEPMKCFLAENQNKKITFEINNCEFQGWPHAGIMIGKNAKGNICFNYIHNNKHYGLGYGVCLTWGTAIIQGNYFNDNRHSIAGTGAKGSGYEASYNIVGPLGTAQAFDMHGGKDRGDGTNIAGSYVVIHNNEFEIENNAIVIRGIPEKGAKIYKNIFRSNIKNIEDHFVQQWYTNGKIDVFDNKFTDNNETVIKGKSVVSPRKLMTKDDLKK